ncbi:hypothetical protein [Schlesneria paludicola]|uniref:hypothetical protein n=1 Tax=Schlesneria paludicola TaxID=360056 RepID=UPI00029B0A8D|nr:hypothetical protein [Schlesneria paludicola]
MARNEHSPEDLERIAAELTEACDRLRAVAKSMKDAEMPQVLIHSATQLNLHIPEVIQWAEKTEVDAKAQLRSFVAGVESKVEIRKRYNANQKAAAAKKPWPKKAAKKKAE